MVRPVPAPTNGLAYIHVAKGVLFVCRSVQQNMLHEIIKTCVSHLLYDRKEEVLRVFQCDGRKSSFVGNQMTKSKRV